MYMTLKVVRGRFKIVPFTVRDDVNDKLSTCAGRAE